MGERVVAFFLLFVFFCLMGCFCVPVPSATFIFLDSVEVLVYLSLICFFESEGGEDGLVQGIL